MPTSAEIRRTLVAALRLDLVGPRPGSEQATEVLPTKPSSWYLTGFLVPFEAPQADREGPGVDDRLDQATRTGGGDDADDTEEASSRKGRLPSSIGLSVLVPSGCRQLEVEVHWGDYRSEEQDGRQVWARAAGHAQLTLDLDGPGSHEVPGGGGLEVVVSVRETEHVGRLEPGTRSVTVFLVNHRLPAARDRKDEAYAFQVRLTLRCDPGFIARPDPRRFGLEDRDERVADLQYRDVGEFATGHAVSTRATVAEGACTRVRTAWVPEGEVHKVDPARLAHVTLGMEALAAIDRPEELQGQLQGLVDQYRAWRIRQEAVVAALEDSGRRETGNDLLQAVDAAADRLQQGIHLLSNQTVFDAFRVANRAMAAAARQREALKRRTDPRAPLEPKSVPAPAWRPFQLAFVLLNLRGLALETDAEREIVDLLFFPTGGGKTEAYLGLAAFVMVYRRLVHGVPAGAGVAVLMRYTLRLLTLDQLGRAAGLICALEQERWADEARLGDWPFEIGLWVGRAGTPNRMGRKGDNDRHSARARVIAYKNNPNRSVPVPLARCPWCGTEFQPKSFRLLPEPDRPTDLRISCLGRGCVFARRREGLPILSVDDVIYRRLPAFLIATVDKFAALPWVGHVGALLGHAQRFGPEGFGGAAQPGPGRALRTPLRPVDLVIQDELHLISGPLGTTVGLYEAALDSLATRDGEDEGVRPKVVASTATIRRADAQIRALFGRSQVAIFPPPGPDRTHSFFAETHPPEVRNARLYVGVAAPGRSMKVVLLRTLLALLSAGQTQWERCGKGRAQPNPADPYTTAVAYFSSLRVLGGSRRIVEDEVNSRLSGYGDRLRVDQDDGPFADRRIRAPVELTSRESTSKVAEAKDRLAAVYGDKQHVDVALATNMISVGLDVTRLGLMVVMGQPKTASEYIQATSRVGRDPSRPGLVVTLHNVYRPRDRSHYERFEAFHSAFYRAVEATSVTPFAPRALDRTLAAVTVGLVRHHLADMTPAAAARDIGAWREPAHHAAAVLGARARRHRKWSDPAQADALEHRVRSGVSDLLDDWCNLASSQAEQGSRLQYGTEDAGPPLLRRPLDPELPTLSPEARKFTAQRSMRDVEPVVDLWARTLDGHVLAPEED